MNQEGEVSVGRASVLYGQEFWRVPTCAEGAAAVRRLSLQSTTSVSTERVLGSLEDEVNAAPDPVPQEGSSHRTVAQKCSVVCPRPEAASTLETAVAEGEGEGIGNNDQAGITALLPVRVNTKTGVDETVTACDVRTHTKKNIAVSDTLVATLGMSNVLTVKPVQNNDRKVQCFSVSNAASVKDPAPTTHSEVNNEDAAEGGEGFIRAPAPSSCKAATVVETSCRPYFSNCTHPTFPAAAAGKTANPWVVIANEIVVVVHLRLQGLHYDTLPAYQEADLLAAFASIFKVGSSPASIFFLFLKLLLSLTSNYILLFTHRRWTYRR